MLAKQVQTQLAQANSVADEALATMTTVRAHAADDSARAAYAVKLAKFYSLQVMPHQQVAPGSTHHCLLPHHAVHKSAVTVVLCKLGVRCKTHHCTDEVLLGDNKPCHIQ